MNTQTVSFSKAGINFTFSLNPQRNSVEMICSKQIFKEDFEYPGAEEIQFTAIRLDKENVRFGEGFHNVYIKVNGNKMNGVRIDNPSALYELTALFSTQSQILEDARKANKEKFEAEQAKRNAARIAPIAEQSGVKFWYGCDTGLLRSTGDKKAIALALKSGAKAEKIYRGRRDATNQFPGHYDSLIPASYLVDGVAVGYDLIEEDGEFISSDDYNAALAVIEQERNEKAELRQAKFDEARTTGEPVLLSKIVLPEAETPLAKDDEGDMVDVCTFAMPDGTTKTEYYHNY